MLAASAVTSPARSYSRIVGANDRIRIAQLGCGGAATVTSTWLTWLSMQGRNGTIENYGGERASLFMVTKEGRPHERDPEGNGRPRYTAPPVMGPPDDLAEIVRLQDAPPPDSLGPNDDDVDHILNWLEAMRDPQIAKRHR